MIKTLKKSLFIDLTYSANSFLYLLQKLPVFQDLLTDDIYKSEGLKRIIRFIMIIKDIIKSLGLKFFYFMMIYLVCEQFFPTTIVPSSCHVYFFLTITGMFINNKLLNVGKKDYFAISLFRMDATKYFRSHIFWNQFCNLFLNGLCIFIFFNFLLRVSFFLCIVLLLLSFFIRPIGELFHLQYFKKHQYFWYSHTNIYFLVLLSGIILCLLPFIHIWIPFSMIEIITIITILLGSISLYVLWNEKKMKLVYKKIFQIMDVMNQKNDKDYYKQAMVNVRDKDKKIDEKKLKNKKGYDFFNTIFFERHKEILNRSAKKYSFIIFMIYLVLGYLVVTNKSVSKDILNFYQHHIGWFVIIMYFINRGAIITQAMFFNCDHAMLTYNDYREPRNLLGIFKQRLLTVTRVNLIPALVVALGNSIILLLLGQDWILCITMMIFILSLSVFFSVHYLVIYYLLQPFNKDLEVKKFSYSFATLATYLVSYLMIDVDINAMLLSSIGIVVTISYMIISLYLVYRLAPKTFKLN